MKSVEVHIIFPIMMLHFYDLFLQTDFILLVPKWAPSNMYMVRRRHLVVRLPIHQMRRRKESCQACHLLAIRWQCWRKLCSRVFWNGSSVVEDPVWLWRAGGMSWNSHHHTCCRGPLSSEGMEPDRPTPWCSITTTRLWNDMAKIHICHPQMGTNPRLTETDDIVL